VHASASEALEHLAAHEGWKQLLFVSWHSWQVSSSFAAFFAAFFAALFAAFFSSFFVIMETGASASYIRGASYVTAAGSTTVGAAAASYFRDPTMIPHTNAMATNPRIAVGRVLRVSVLVNTCSMIERTTNIDMGFTSSNTCEP